MPMTAAVFAFELKKRGFVFNSRCNEWTGPFNIKVSGALSQEDDNQRASRSTVDNAFARVETLQVVDEQLRAARGQPRPPLVPPLNIFDTNFNPTIRPLPRPSSG